MMAVLDTEKPSDLSEQECKALIVVLELRNRLSDMLVFTVHRTVNSACLIFYSSVGFS